MIDTVEALLGAQGLAVLSSVSPPSERSKVEDGIQACGRSLEVIRRIDLTPHELADAGVADLATWNALAPEIRSLLVSVRSTVHALRELFPADDPSAGTDSIDLDGAFQEAEDFTPDRGPQVDAALADERTSGAVVGVLTAMLEEDIVRFGQRMRSPQLVADRWALLGELHELKSHCAQCLDAVVAALLRPHTTQPVENWLPTYASAGTRAARLRRDIVDLHRAVVELHARLTADSSQLSDICREVERLLREFATQPSYADLRPLDKQQILQFRIWLLQAQRADAGPRFEDFGRCLEVMQDINRRPVLRDHDRAQLDLAVMLLESEEPVDATRACLEAVYGRSAELDALLRRWPDDPPSPDVLLAGVLQVRDGLN